MGLIKKIGRGIGNAFRGVERHVTRPIAHGVKNVAKAAGPVLPAAVGFMTGNPWLAAAAGGVSGAAQGGGFKGAMLGAAGAGLGTLGGQAFGALGTVPGIARSTLMAYAPALGAGMGYAGGLMSGLKRRPLSLNDVSYGDSPTYDLLKKQAIEETNDILQQTHMFDMLRKNLRIAQVNRTKNIYNYARFSNFKERTSSPRSFNY